MTERGLKQGQGQSPREAMEADAVCEQCGMVNPEDTLLCKNCGNNLREQRARRLNESRVREQREVKGPPTRWLGHLLTVFGLLLILWTGLNVNRIEEWLTQTQTQRVAGGTGLFAGPDSPSFDVLADRLRAKAISQSEINRALATTANPEDPQGRYILMAKSAGRPQVIGEGIIHRERKEFFIVAQFRNGLELRGVGKVDRNGLIRAEEVAVRSGDQLYTGHGFAQPSETGLGYEVYGVSGESETGYEAMAYAIPSEEAQEPAP